MRGLVSPALPLPLSGPLLPVPPLSPLPPSLPQEDEAHIELSFLLRLASLLPCRGLACNQCPLFHSPALLIAPLKPPSREGKSNNFTFSFPWCISLSLSIGTCVYLCLRATTEEEEECFACVFVFVFVWRGGGGECVVANRRHGREHRSWN